MGLFQVTSILCCTWHPAGTAVMQQTHTTSALQGGNLFQDPEIVNAFSGAIAGAAEHHTAAEQNSCSLHWRLMPAAPHCMHALAMLSSLGAVCLQHLVCAGRHPS
jgi:hypothetical protein